MKLYRYWFPIVLLCLAIFACNLPSLTTSSPSFLSTTTPISTAQEIPSQPSIPSPVPTVVYQPVFESAPCAFVVPSGYSPDCGYLVVPENRARPNSRSIRLHVAIFRNRAGIRVSDPVVHLAGGPGSSSLNVAGYLFDHGLGAILEKRDFILFDQRGTGYSQ